MVWFIVGKDVFLYNHFRYCLAWSISFEKSVVSFYKIGALTTNTFKNLLVKSLNSLIIYYIVC